MDTPKDRHEEKEMLLMHTLTMRESDGQTDQQQTHGRMDTSKNNVALAHLTIRGSDVASKVEFSLTWIRR